MTTSKFQTMLRTYITFAQYFKELQIAWNVSCLAKPCMVDYKIPFFVVTMCMYIIAANQLTKKILPYKTM